MEMPCSRRRFGKSFLDSRKINKKRKVAKNQHNVLVTDPNFKNDGDIEVVLDSSFPDEAAFDRSRRVNYRLPESTIKLAFKKKSEE
jgi:hypothetical protein